MPLIKRDELNRRGYSSDLIGKGIVMQDYKQQAFVEWLVIRSQQGDREAFRDLVQAWQPRLLSYAAMRLASPDAAQDVSQECWVAIDRGLARLKDPVAFPRWSFRILERRCNDWFRQAYRRREDAVELESLPEAAATDSTESEMDAGRLLAALDPALAALLRLYYLEELSLGDIAEILEIPRGTVKSRLFYARKLIRDSMLEHETENEDESTR